MRVPILDRTRISQNQRIRRQPSGISLPLKGLPGGRAVENEGMKITVVGVLAIAGIVLLLGLLIRVLCDKPPGNGSNSLE
jgi:hypothetical protein